MKYFKEDNLKEDKYLNIVEDITGTRPDNINSKFDFIDIDFSCYMDNIWLYSCFDKGTYYSISLITNDNSQGFSSGESLWDLFCKDQILWIEYAIYHKETETLIKREELFKSKDLK